MNKVVIKGIKTALIVGTILTLINQWQGVFGEEPVKWLPLALTYTVPFLVFMYSYYSNRSR